MISWGIRTSVNRRHKRTNIQKLAGRKRKERKGEGRKGKRGEKKGEAVLETWLREEGRGEGKEGRRYAIESREEEVSEIGKGIRME